MRRDMSARRIDENSEVAAFADMALADAPYREKRYTAQDGLSLYYRAYGDPLAPGVAVLCLPGLVRNSRDFHRTAARLSPRHYVLCPDYRGRGRSDYDPHPTNYIAPVHLADALHLLAVEGVHRVAVIGTSFGGLLAMALGVAAPSMLAGVVLNDIGPEFQDNGVGRIYGHVSRDNPQPDWDSANRELKRLFPQLRFPGEQLWRDAVEGTWQPGDDGVLHHDWDTRIADPIRTHTLMQDFWSYFRSLRAVPVLATHAANSDILSPETFARMAAAHPGLVQVEVPDTSHAPSLLEPECIAAVDRFIAGLDT